VEYAVRRATLEDAGRIASLFDAYRQFYGKPPEPEVARRFIQARLAAGESVIFLAAARDGETLGFVQLYPSFSSVEARPLWVLNDLYVGQEVRGLGVGRALMEAAKKHAVETGAKRLTLETAEDNRTAWSLYESLGYASRGPSTRFYELELD